MGMIAGAKALSCIQNGNFDILKSGFSSYGALLGAIIMTGVYCAALKTSFSQLMCISIIPMALTYSIGKIGCFSAGCCYGINYNGFMSVIYDNSPSAPADTALFPVQLAEAVAFFALFLAFYVFYKTHSFSSVQVCIYIMLISLIKGSLYYLRNESLSQPFGSHQVICVLLFSVSLIFLIKDIKERRLNNEQLHSEL